MLLGPRDTVRAPDGTVWQVTRVWLPRAPRWRGPRPFGRRRRQRDLVGDTLDTADLGFQAADLLEDLGFVVLALVALALAVFFVVPGLVFLAELLLVLLLTALAVAGRVLLGRPWRVEAVAADGRRRAWDVTGWSRSRHAVTAVAWALQNGQEVSLPGAAERRT